MRPLIIMTDSTADLSPDIRRERQIHMIPLYVRFQETVYQDGVDIKTDDLYQKVNEEGIIPATAAVSPGDFIKTFTPLIEKGYDILYTGIGSTLSATFQSALIAKTAFPDDNIFLVDSKNLSSGIALLVLKACDLRDQGLSGKDIKRILEQDVPRVRSQFAIRTLDYLHKGGRASQTAKLLGTVLGIKPIIKVTDGVLDVYKKPAGKMSRALDVMINQILDDREALDTTRIMITHSQAEKSVSYMLEALKDQIKASAIVISEAGCVISSHCGPGTIGILYMLKS